MRLIVFLSMLVSAGVAGQTGSVDIGRLFTTPEQRQELDQVRYAVEIKPVDLATDNEIQSKEQNAIPSIDPIIVKGLIYSDNGTSAAWINGNNTLHGGLNQEHIGINLERITADQVPILLKHSNKVINLKVGESYIPEQKKNHNTVMEAE